MFKHLIIKTTKIDKIFILWVYFVKHLIIKMAHVLKDRVGNKNVILNL